MYRQPLDNPVYAVLESTNQTVSSPRVTSSSSSYQTDGELYSEVMPAVSDSSNNAGVALPSFYDIVRLPAPLPGARVGEDEERVERGGSECDDGVVCSKKRRSVAEGNLYESLSDPVTCLDEKGDYSSLDRRREYATLEPYTGSRTTRNGLRLGQHTKESDIEEEYAHLHH